MMLVCLVATNKTCSVLGTWGFNLCMIKGFGLVVGVFSATKMRCPFGFCRLGFLGRGPERDCIL